ncbi:MAG: ATP-binding cassette domain-containing protein [Defluviitaleaceae bacterium]|nr:ATP-binding cassette domain-containing protein [Defluviitaleaceae bacterium]
MIDISLHELHKYYGANHVLQGISLEIFSGEKIGLLGRNGAGKTTLFKVLAEDEDYESGTLSKASGKRVEILAQIPDFDEGATVEDILRSSFAEVTAIYRDMKTHEELLATDYDDKIMTRYGKLMEDYERLGGYDVDYKIDKICNGMNISDAMKNGLFATLSGGEKTRVNLARILLRECDILLLDEPTNHLDFPSLHWLEQFLNDFKGTVVCISHDRTFLDNVVKRIIEVDFGKVHFYGGAYTFYAGERALRHAQQAEQYQRQQKEIKRIEERAKWFVQNNRFTTKHHAILSRLDHMEKVDRPNTVRKVNEDFKVGGHAGKIVVEFDGVSKAFGDKTLLQDASLIIKRGDNIALVGPNGCGKSTFIKLITGEEMPDAGTVKVASNIKFAYLPQIVTFADPTLTMLETVRNETGLPEDKARAMLASFNFRMDDVTKKVSALSGGERSRLKLALLMQDKINFLILDEPTNHLDIESREWIEEAISAIDHDCTLLMISHDRYFIDKFATRMWEMGAGQVVELAGE